MLIKTPQKLFGTDGIRGKSNQFPMQSDIVLKVGQALGFLLRQTHKNIQVYGKRGSIVRGPMVLIGKDTRLSGYMLEQALASGLNSMGVWVQLTGPLPTPGIGFLARNMRAVAGIVISASHNPYQDNGIKIFDAQGFKISRSMEQEIESLVFSEDLNNKIAPASQVGRSRRIDDAAGRYIVHVKNTFPVNASLEGIRLVLDCANGACYKVAPKIFEELGAEVIVLAHHPNGYNINEQAGALHPQKIQEAVLKHKAAAGISLDGDGDRVIMVDEKGDLVNGDHILGICAVDLQRKRELTGNKVTATYMSNQGLEDMLRKKNIQLFRTEVGDRNVVEHMKQHNITLGGEPSGHIIFLKQNTTGDGCIAALNVLALMQKEKTTLSQLKSMLVATPQVKCSIPIAKNIWTDKQLSLTTSQAPSSKGLLPTQESLEKIPGYNKLIREITGKLKNKGRVYLRFSGTEPVLRILVEGKDQKLIQSCADKLKSFLCKHLQ